MKYYHLSCRTCSINFSPLLCTYPGELLHPDFEDCRQGAGAMNADRLEDFHRTHAGHELVELPDPTSTAHFRLSTEPTLAPNDKKE